MKKLFASLFLLLGLTHAAVAANDDPVDLIRDTSSQVLDLLKKENGKNTQQIRNQVEAAVMPKFDFQRMTALAVGRGWRDATPQQQQKLIDEFQDLLVRTYSVSMTRFKNAQINVKPNPVFNNEGREATVKSDVLLPNTQDKKPIAIDYTLYKSGQGWKVYNVSVEGASLVTLYRNQFNEEIRKNGVDGLIRSLQVQNNKAAQGA